MAKIFVEDKAYEVKADESLLQACLGLGFNLPYFCWHPALGSVGACRQCAVKQFKDENDKRGRLVMACMTPASEGTRISIDDKDAADFRKGVVEGLMLNHPHDCPVCDEGGECHLQDMTVMTGHDYRRTIFPKRTYRNQYLGPLVNHEMNRCIQCYRCVRYYRDYAGGRDLDAFSLRNQVFFGRQEDGVLENEFAGNLVEICPTGVFTDATLRKHYTRKWDLQMSPSVCVHCGLGCNTSPGERYGSLRRIVNRYNGEVNGYFLCDRGRFGYEFVNSAERIREPLMRQDGKLHPAPKVKALERAAAMLHESKRVIGIGSPRASLEANFALRSMVGAANFYAGFSDGGHRLSLLTLDLLSKTPARLPSLKEVEQADAALVLGEDISNTAPRMALALRQSVRQQPLEQADKLKIPRWLDFAVRELAQDEKGPLFIATAAATRLDDAATEIYHGAPDDLARLGFAVANAIDSSAPAVANLAETERALVQKIAAALKDAKRPVIVSGPSLNSAAVMEAAAGIAHALAKAGKDAALSLAAPECNTIGLAILGGGKLGDALKAVHEKAADTVIILENDLYSRAPAAAVDEFFEIARRVIALDSVNTRTTAKAEVALPAAPFAESDGTLVSSEGRAQRFFQSYLPKGDIQEGWLWTRDILLAAGRREAAAWESLDHVIASLTRAVPALAGIENAAPTAATRLVGTKVPREPHRYSGRTAMLANINVSEPKPPDDADSALSFSMEGYANQPPSSLQPFFWSPGWNSIQSVNKFQAEIDGPLRGGDPGVRLLQTGQSANGAHAPSLPQAFAARADEWLLIPLYHVFGSEELSRLAPGVAELAPKPYLALNSADAAKLGFTEGQQVEITVAGARHRLPVSVRADLPKGTAGVPAGVVPVDEGSFPAWTRIAKA